MEEDDQYLKSSNAQRSIGNQSIKLLASAITPVSSVKRMSPFSAVINGVSNGHAVFKDSARLLQSKVTPAGAYHLSMKFGTVLVESGVASMTVADVKHSVNRGILVSPQFSTSLLLDKKENSVLLYEPADGKEVGERNKVICYATRCNVYVTKKVKGQQSQKQVRVIKRPMEERSSLACMKVVYGAAFSGYPDSENKLEIATVDALANEAFHFYRQFSRSTPPITQRSSLNSAADRVLMKLKRALETEVDKYSLKIARTLLHPPIKLGWKPLSNNCQHLVDSLLSGKEFEYFFPRLPKEMSDLENNGHSLRWPRYLLSFNDRVDSAYITLQQPQSILGRFLNESRFGDDILYFLDIDQRRSRDRSRYLAFSLDTRCMSSAEARAVTHNILWELPRDTLSILKYHMVRDRNNYIYVQQNGLLEARKWLENRLLLLQLADIFACMSASLGSCLLNLFRNNPSLVNRVVLPKARILGSMRAGERVRIIHLPGRQTVYMISSQLSERAEGCFNTPEDTLDSIVGLLAAKLRTWKPEFTRTLAETLTLTTKGVLLMYGITLSARPTRGFRSVTDGNRVILPAMNGLGSILYNSDISSIEAGRRDSWMHLDMGDVIMVLQLFRKSKTVRNEVENNRMECSGNISEGDKENTD